MASPENFTAGSATRSLAYLIDLAVAGFGFAFLAALLEFAQVRIDAGFGFAAAVAVYQAWFLSAKQGSTPGKFIRNVCVISATGHGLAPGQAVARACLTALPYACLAAGDLEVAPVSHGLVSLLPVVGVAYLFADLVMLEYHRTRRTVTDRLTQTLVVQLPPLQPHRAPAVPMFSANDAEFGHPPRRPPS